MWNVCVLALDKIKGSTGKGSVLFRLMKRACLNTHESCLWHTFRMLNSIT